MNVKIITDSLSDIPKDIAGMYDIEVLPVDIKLGDKTYKDGSDLRPIETIEWIEENRKVPTLHGIGSDVYLKVFQKYADEGRDVICITTGSKFVSNFDCACHASSKISNAKVLVIDSNNLCGLTCLMVIKAAIMAQHGESANSIDIQIERSMKKYISMLCFDSLDFAKLSGPNNFLMNIGLLLLGNKYKISSSDSESHTVEPLGRTMDKAITKFCESSFKKVQAIDPKRIVIVHSPSNENYFAELHRYIVSLNYFEDIIVVAAGSYVVSKLGRNAVGINIEYK